MTDITKQSFSPPRAFLSQDAIQLFYRLLAAFLICVALSLLSNSFLSVGNLLNVLRQTSLTFFIASGLTLVVLTAGLEAMGKVRLVWRSTLSRLPTLRNESLKRESATQIRNAVGNRSKAGWRPARGERAAERRTVW